ncbi:bifunctional fucokinase/L-fucose-1-P-guanylyltransferase [Blautia schinkii]|nr:bifunctional fucokinase/L-fucose-1-P-guanylyltransferase [Blautia schinkii]
MKSKYNKIKNLFLRQSYLDSWEDYCRSLQKATFLKWDYVVLSASNESQAIAFRAQINERIEKKQLPSATQFVVLSDPEGKRVGSGGATFNVLRYLAEKEPSGDNPFVNKRVLVIHSGGDSKRVPQYSAVGKLFSPVPRELPDGRASTLFDEFMIAMSGVPSRFKEGMLVLSGDVLLLFNPLQIDSVFHGAAAISIKESVETGKDHGVFLSDERGYVRNFLHKQSIEKLAAIGAINPQGNVDLDTGAILLDTDILNSLFGLISTEGKTDTAKFNLFVSETSRISFYGDILYPLASDSTLEQYYREKPEGDYTEELYQCRKELWTVLRQYSLKLFSLAPAQFIHFGTTSELLQLLTGEIGDYEFLDWSNQIVTTGQADASYAGYCSYIGHNAVVEGEAYIEASYVLGNTSVGKGSIVSHVKLRNAKVPSGIVLHGLPLSENKYVVRIYGITDNPKKFIGDKVDFLGTTLEELIARYDLDESDLWDVGVSHDLWNGKLYPVCTSLDEALEWALILYDIVQGNQEKLMNWIKQKRVSLARSFNEADSEKIQSWQLELECRILCRKFLDLLKDGIYYKDAFRVFGNGGISENHYITLLEDAGKSDFALRIRIYYALSRYMKEHGCSFANQQYDYTEGLCFQTVKDVIYKEYERLLPDSSSYKIEKKDAYVNLPVRVNFGGGWTDTPPYCNEQGGVVLNAAVKLNGIYPIQVYVKKIPELVIEFESQDIGVKGTAHSTEEVLDCHNPFDSFALHKAALIACGIIRLDEKRKLQDILASMGGGLYISTQVVNIPKGSGLGTSSILAAACVKALFEIVGNKKRNEEIYEIVLCMEQIMSTGGGWQDQVGGLTPGFKFITSTPGYLQKLEVTDVRIPQNTMDELQKRFVIIYTGQRRLARNLLRDVMGNYIGAKASTLDALEKMKPVAALMKFYLEQGNIDKFSSLMNEHWELSKQLDAGSTNTCIEQIFIACEDMIEGKFICGAGGGGFLMVMLKKDFTKDDLSSRLAAIFQDSGIMVWDSEFV